MASGIDVSMHQRVIDWPRVKRAGYSFAYIKATEGEAYVDPYYTRNVADATKAGVKVGAYHFLRPKPGRKGSAEADDFCRALKAAKLGPGDLIPVCDIETTALSATATEAYVEEFLNAVQATVGVRPLIYTYPSFLNGRWRSSHRAKLWIAHYGVSKPRLPAPWKSYVAWQYTSSGSVPGVSGNCDMNRAPALAQLLWAKPVPLKPTPPPKPKPKPRNAPMTVREIQAGLRKIGFPIKVDGKIGPQTRLAIRCFKASYVGTGKGAPLSDDNAMGPRARAALRTSLARNGWVSEHFKFREFSSKQPGVYDGVPVPAGWPAAHHELVRALERLRKKVGPIGVLSGFRPYAVGASRSQHKIYRAMDPSRPLPPPTVIAGWKCGFSGIGYDPRNGGPASAPTRHLDVRHTGPWSGGATPSNPAIFTDTF